MDYYFAEWQVKTRLGETQAIAERLALLDAPCPPRRPARLALGLALMRLGRWVLGGLPHPNAARPVLLLPTPAVNCNREKA